MNDGAVGEDYEIHGADDVLHSVCDDYGSAVEMMSASYSSIQLTDAASNHRLS